MNTDAKIAEILNKLEGVAPKVYAAAQYQAHLDGVTFTVWAVFQAIAAFTLLRVGLHFRNKALLPSNKSDETELLVVSWVCFLALLLPLSLALSSTLNAFEIFSNPSFRAFQQLRSLL